MRIKLKMEHMETFRKLNIHKIKAAGKSWGRSKRSSLRHVWFRYPFTEGYALRGLTFTVRKGQKVGIVGVNGAGKSTVIKLMTRLYDTTEGSVLINGRDIREYDLESLRGAFSATSRIRRTMPLRCGRISSFRTSGGRMKRLCGKRWTTGG